MIETLTIVMAFASVFLIVIGLKTRPVDAVEARLRGVQTGMRHRNPMLSQPFIRRAAVPMASGFVRMIMKFMPPTWLAATEQKIAWGGGAITLPGFILIWTSMTIMFGVLAYIFASTFGLGLLLLLLAVGSGVVVGAFLPQMWLSARVNQRHYLARKGLPDALDLMTTSVEAGLSLDSAMIRVAEFQRGPFQDELGHAMQDMTLGKSRSQALGEIGDRLNVPEVITLIQTINQAEVTGAPIGRVLRVQAEQVRIRRRQAAEAQANRAPLLMIIPLVFFILPSLFIVLLAPAALTIIDIFSNSGIL